MISRDTPDRAGIKRRSWGFVIGYSTLGVRAAPLVPRQNGIDAARLGRLAARLWQRGSQ
jgi:hypothetical protein